MVGVEAGGKRKVDGCQGGSRKQKHRAPLFSNDQQLLPPIFDSFATTMDERLDFNINEALKQYLSDPSTIPTPEAPSALVDCEDEPEALTSAVVNSALNPVVDAVAESPAAILRQASFDTVAFLLRCAPISQPQSQRYDTAPYCEPIQLSRSSS